jgi:hypothetical protein
MNTEATSNLFAELHGEQLNSVTFVHDYLQLFFDGPGINVTNPLTVQSGEQTITSWAPGFRDLLCAQITKRVKKAECVEGDSLCIIFEDDSRISVSLKPEDYSSPEAIYAHGFSNNQWIVE